MPSRGVAPGRGSKDPTVDRGTSLWTHAVDRASRRGPDPVVTRQK